MKGGSVLLLGMFLVAWVEAHSWMQCADYSQENGQFWDVNKCRGWPRDYKSKFQYNNIFGGDVGYNYQPTDAAPCLTKYSATSYDTQYSMASYSPGQRVCLAWPPKNHVAATCNNPNIPDRGTKIYRTGPLADFTGTDPTLTQFHQNLVADLGTNTQAGAGVGFQNCPDFCANPDKCLCTGCFNIPTTLAQGKYTFLWEWAFNADTDLYTTCFDINIVANSGNSVTALAKIGPDAFKALTTAAVTVSSSSATTASSGSASGTTGSASAASTGSASAGSTSSGDNFGPCPAGSLRCNCTTGGTCDSGNVCASGVCVRLSDVENIHPPKSSAGNIAVAVILTFIAVVAVGAGVLLVARMLPQSPVGLFVHKIIDKTPTASMQARRDPLPQNQY